MFNKKYSLYIVGLILLFSFTNCKSKFEKLRNSNNLAMKYQEAVKFYENGKYSKARTLFDDLMVSYRGRSEAEDLYYYTAYTNYRMKDYISARHHFKSFAQTFPNSPRAEECRFMTAYCYYLESPRSSLDQDNTRRAIDELQLFVNIYPESERAEEASDLIQDLREKLEKKAFDNAKLYYDMGMPGDYKAAVIALENVLRQYPDTRFAEEIEYLIVKAQYLYADNSIPIRQEERFNEALDYYDMFAESYTSSQYMKELNDLRSKSERKIAAVVKQIEESKRLQEERNRELGIEESEVENAEFEQTEGSSI